jgi:hypothetical protein
MLNHSAQGDITAGYTIIDVNKLRGPMQAIADRFAALCEVAEPIGENIAAIA